MSEQDYVSSREAKWNLPVWEAKVRYSDPSKKNKAQLKIIKGEDGNTYHLQYQLPHGANILHEGTLMNESDVLYHGIFNNPETHDVLRHLSFDSLIDMLDQIPEDATLIAGPRENGFENGPNRYISKLNFIYHFVTTEEDGKITTDTVRLQIDPVESVLAGLSLHPEGVYLKVKTSNGDDRTFPIYKPQIGSKPNQIELKDNEKGWGTEFRVIVRDDKSEDHATLTVNGNTLGKVVDWGTLDEYDALVNR